VLGVVIATALGWGDIASIALSVGLAFLFGYGLRFWLPLLGGFAIAWPFAFAVNRAMIARGKGTPPCTSTTSTEREPAAARTRG
jgi:hypothetical protein